MRILNGGSREQIQSIEARVSMLQFKLKEAQADAVLVSESPMQTELTRHQNLVGGVMSFIDHDLLQTVLQDLSYDESPLQETTDEPVSTPPSKVTSTARSFVTDVQHERSKNVALLEVAKMRTAQLAKKEQQCVDLAGELARWDSKYQRLEDRLKLKERELRVTVGKAEEERRQAKIKFAVLRAKESEKVAKASSDRERVIAEQEAAIKELQTKLMNVTLLMAESGIDTFDLSNSATVVSSDTDVRKVQSMEEKPANFFAKLMWS